LFEGIVATVVSLGGIALVVVAFVARRDGAVGAVPLVCATFFCLLHLVVGAGYLKFGFMTLPSPESIYVSSDGSFRVTLPSQQWQQAQLNENGGDGVVSVAFVQASPRMQAKVSVKQQQLKEHFDRAVQTFRGHVVRLGAANHQAQFQEGTTPGGNHYSYCTLMDSSKDGKPVFVGHSLIWCPDRQTVFEVFFEGVVAMRSEAGKASEMAVFQRSAETLCLSPQ
jgi:hypothetical protein